MIRLYVVSIIALFCSACATQQIVPAERFVWPPPPDIARIEWLKSYSSQLDLEKSSSQRFWAAIAGDDAPRTFLKPVEVKSIPELDKFLVSDIGMSAVIVFDLANHEVRTLKVPDNSSPMLMPLSIALDQYGSIYVLERRSATIRVFNSSEKYERSIRLIPVSIKSPNSMIIDKKKGEIYISDAATRKIVVTDLQGQFVRSIGESTDSDNQFNLPIAMALNSKGNLFVADAFGANIQVFDQNGRFINKLGKRGDSAGDFQLIKSIAIDSTDNIYVVDGRASNITILNEQGELLLVLGGYYVSATSGKMAPGGFAIPIGIDIDSTDKIYVVDQMNKRVQVFQYFSEGYLQNHPQ